MFYQGIIRKMKSQLEEPVEYMLPIDKDSISMNNFIGKYILFKYENQIYCIGCGRKINKTQISASLRAKVKTIYAQLYQHEY